MTNLEYFFAGFEPPTARTRLAVYIKDGGYKGLQDAQALLDWLLAENEEEKAEREAAEREEMTLEDLREEIAVRTYNCMARHYMNRKKKNANEIYLKDICADFTRATLYKAGVVRNLGKRSAEDLEAALQRFGFKLKEK